ncbi:hypothetical protein DKG77_07375 [Flagellimonas aquimarina]|uniref:Uncharacterized protein n=1 Tax=Flagellimonas aquimarina TaxID=2201895 RepID=A0A316KZ47_9FLAO|nr:hypothetical protein [Allomuricauda koreensis]PWL38105.1 hypothetical protein DKG77_07375 [Allomuricauda koreensis]
MKKTITIMVLLLMACGSNKHGDFDSAEVNYISNDRLESLTVSSFDIGENQEEAIFNAKRLAFQNLFFRGISNSPFNKPLIGINEHVEYKKHKDYLNSFYNSRMGTFITNYTQSVSKVKRGKRSARIDMTINMLALRKDLEENGIIKKFGL